MCCIWIVIQCLLTGCAGHEREVRLVGVGDLGENGDGPSIISQPYLDAALKLPDGPRGLVALSIDTRSVGQRNQNSPSNDKLNYTYVDLHADGTRRELPTSDTLREVCHQPLGIRAPVPYDGPPGEIHQQPGLLNDYVFSVPEGYITVKVSIVHAYHPGTGQNYIPPDGGFFEFNLNDNTNLYLGTINFFDVGGVPKPVFDVYRPVNGDLQIDGITFTRPSEFYARPAPEERNPCFLVGP
jgi:hypothetical protein